MTSAQLWPAGLRQEVGGPEGSEGKAGWGQVRRTLPQGLSPQGTSIGDVCGKQPDLSLLTWLTRHGSETHAPRQGPAQACAALPRPLGPAGHTQASRPLTGTRVTMPLPPCSEILLLLWGPDGSPGGSHASSPTGRQDGA